MVERGLQYGYSRRFAKYMYDEPSRRNKALRAIQILREHRPDLESCNTIEIGSATGIMTFYLADVFKEVVGVDIDTEALTFARTHFQKSNIRYLEMDALHLQFPDASFDTVICHHTYEHVADSQKLMDEIFRILKPHGLVVFGAPNRLMLKESHYDLYFLSWLPKRVASWILACRNQGNYYYESMLTLWGLKKLCSRFVRMQDYTLACILDPQKYHSQDVVDAYPWLKKMPVALLRLILVFAPDFVFLLKK